MLDYIAICKELNGKRIKYIVVGGVAINIHGIPRMTYDLDFILDLEDNNLETFLKLLKSWGFKPRAPVDIMDFAKKEKRELWIKDKNMKAFTLQNPEWAMSEIDIVINTPLDYEKAAINIKYVKIKNVSVPTISIDDLIKMKQQSNRQQDIADIRNLRKLTK